MKIVINKCYGGFGLSPEALLWLYDNGNGNVEIAKPALEYFSGDKTKLNQALMEWRAYLGGKRKYADLFLSVFSPDEQFILCENSVHRDDPRLVACVEELGNKSYGLFAKLEVVDIPDGISWEIDEYDGMECIAEQHRRWG